MIPASPKTINQRSQGILVDTSESGLKLMGLLERRLELPSALLHRWIRTGQIRLNGGRVQPFTRVNAGDSVRVPPFAGAMSLQAKTAQEKATQRKQAVQQAKTTNAPSKSVRSFHTPRVPSLEILAEADADGLMAVVKPAGLPTHPGTGHTDSVSTRLRRLDPHAVFPPTPIHRLDRDTSGVLLVAKSFAVLKATQELLHARKGLQKEYLAWVEGWWPEEQETILKHYLAKRIVGTREKMVVTEAGQGLEALLALRPLVRTRECSLMLIRLFTGRTHQIRVQLAAVGHPLLGDGKYGSKHKETGLLLHSLRIKLPDGRSFSCLPSWPAPYNVDQMPSPIELDIERKD